ncbi:MAG: AAA family ATPase [Legionella sp.]|nr:MAG: AAA family ATPase [Legionella sp.]
MMYQDFFHLTEFPFNQYPNIDYYYNLENHQKSLDVLMVGLQVNDGVIKITGQPGTGKSMLCRLFIEKIANHDYPVYVMNPYFTYAELLELIASKLEISCLPGEQPAQILKSIHDKAQLLKQESKKIVLLFDEAQYLSKENLEVIQILGNLECAGEKLCQVVLIGGLDLDAKLRASSHFLQRISFSYTLLPIKQKDLNNYVFHRLAKATKSGKKHGVSISPQASRLLYKKTKGIPRLINIVCHKALMLAYSRSEHHLSKELISKAIVDTEYTSVPNFWQNLLRTSIQRAKKMLDLKIPPTE